MKRATLTLTLWLSVLTAAIVSLGGCGDRHTEANEIAEADGQTVTGELWAHTNEVKEVPLLGVTFHGLIHASGIQLATSWTIYDGEGNYVTTMTDSPHPLQLNPRDFYFATLHMVHLQDFDIDLQYLLDERPYITMSFTTDHPPIGHSRPPRHYPPQTISVTRWRAEYLGRPEAEGEAVETIFREDLAAAWIFPYAIPFIDDGHDYIYVIEAWWPQGRSQYVFRVNSGTSHAEADYAGANISHASSFATWPPEGISEYGWLAATEFLSGFTYMHLEGLYGTYYYADYFKLFDFENSGIPDIIILFQQVSGWHDRLYRIFRYYGGAYRMLEMMAFTADGQHLPQVDFGRDHKLFIDAEERILSFANADYLGAGYDHLVFVDNRVEFHRIAASDGYNWEEWDAHHWGIWEDGPQGRVLADSWIKHNPTIFGTDITLTPIKPLDITYLE